MKRFAVLFAFALLLVSSASAKTLINVDKNGVAIQGYDPVAFFTDNRPVKGNASFQSSYNGVTYYFSSPQNKAEFDKNPSKYEPQFGGYCAYGASKGQKAPVEIDAFQIVNGRLLLQYDKDVRDIFNKDTQGNLRKADGNWPTVVEKYGK